MMPNKKRSQGNSGSSREMYLYLKDVSKFPLLTVEEEQELSRRASRGDHEAIQRLVQSNLRFVIKVAKRYQAAGLPLLDLINEGNVGLIEAANRFDPNRGVRFTSYAVWWIRQAILHFLSRSGQPIRIAPKMANLLYRLSRLLEQRTDAGDSIDREKISKELGVSVHDIDIALGAMAGALSLDQPVSEESARLLRDMFEQTAIPSPETITFSKSLQTHLRKSLMLLSKTEREILYLRFGLTNDQSLTLREIGSKMGYSRERVRQIENQALQKLRESNVASSLSAYMN